MYLESLVETWLICLFQFKFWKGKEGSRSSERMLILQEFLQFPFDNGNRGTPSYF